MLESTRKRYELETTNVIQVDIGFIRLPLSMNGCLTADHQIVHLVLQVNRADQGADADPLNVMGPIGCTCNLQHLLHPITSKHNPGSNSQYDTFMQGLRQVIIAR